MWEFHHLVYLNKLHDHEFCPHATFSSAAVLRWSTSETGMQALDFIFLANPVCSGNVKTDKNGTKRCCVNTEVEGVINKIIAHTMVSFFGWVGRRGSDFLFRKWGPDLWNPLHQLTPHPHQCTPQHSPYSPSADQITCDHVSRDRKR